ncbi:Kinesin-like protein [Trachipleistophora hominis]|uniref:Kinesin-like protein n=1 Tax=Trachipleistophora hominis TaxID=72359 RepID=L7JU16_TRAHO|nr:Kinesin-like protein [Trachipleistophora hominis]
MSEKVNVYVRVRNKLTNELDGDQDELWFLKDNLLHQKIEDDKFISYFCYKKVFYMVDNCGLYKECIEPNIQPFVSGKSLTVFAYGQTGSGKTHTMTGKPSDMGIIGRTLEDIYNSMDEAAECYISYFEIYNENIIDLINTNNKPRVFTYNNELIVKGIERTLVSSLDKSLRLIKGCEERRKTGQTQFNLRSSRSHTIFKLELQNTNSTSTMTLIDLAGSEKASGTSLRIREGVYINKSLLALGKVINSLNKNEFTSYRESKLTRVLQSSMTGNVTLIALCMISPDRKCLDESISTLNFASRLCQIEMRNRTYSSKQLQTEPVICDNCRRELNRKDRKISVDEITDSSSAEDFTLMNPEKVKNKNSAEQIIQLQNKRIHSLESMIITLLGQNPSQRENEIFTLEKNMFNLQLEMLKRPDKINDEDLSFDQKIS